MLRHLAVENFKCFGDRQVAPLGPITLLYGPNSGGKSSLIKALLLLKQTFEGYVSGSPCLVPRGRLVDLGSFKSMLHRHDVEKELTISVKYDPTDLRGGPRCLLPRSPQTKAIDISYRANASSTGDKHEVAELSRVLYELNEPQSLRLQMKNAGKGPEEEDKFEFDSPWFSEKNDRQTDTEVGLLQRLLDSWPTSEFSPFFEGASDSSWPSDWRVSGELLQKLYAMPTDWSPLPVQFAHFQDKSEGSREGATLANGLTNFLMRIAREFRTVLQSISYLGPLRSRLERYYQQSGVVKNSVGNNGEDLASVAYANRKGLIKKVNHWFERFDIPYLFEVRAAGNDITGQLISLALIDLASGLRINTADVGFGIGQLLPIIVEGVLTQNNTIVVEQPEIHLHPRLQAHVADLIIQTAALSSPKFKSDRNTTPGKQWIVETHSETLILRVQRRIREGLVRPDDVSVLYLQPDGEGGTEIFHLEMDRDGEFIDEWPGGFFEESYDELFVETAK